MGNRTPSSLATDLGADGSLYDGFQLFRMLSALSLNDMLLNSIYVIA